MPKDFTDWNRIKTDINNYGQTQYFQEREIWWSSIGLNIGFEQDGKGQGYSRPCLILKKFNLSIFLSVPLTTNMSKNGKYYFPIGMVNGRAALAVLSQIRLCDAKRLTNKIMTLNKDKFVELKKTLQKVNFS